MSATGQQAGRYQRSFPGMIGAMLVLIGVVLAFVVFREVNRNDPADPVKPVDYAAPARYAQQSVDYELLAPETLPDGWKATSVSFRAQPDQAWHLGCLTEDGHYVGLEQAERPAYAMVDDFVDKDASRGPDVRLGGQTWQSWTDAEGDRALVREDGDTSTLLVGDVPQSVLEEYYATLR